jgi:uncharacterized MnhB-related membrane protein
MEVYFERWKIFKKKQVLNKDHFILVRIRYLQAKRLLKADLIGGVIVSAVIFLLAASSYQLFQSSTYALYLLGGLTVFCFFIQLYRNDKKFIYNNIYSPHRAIFFEYLAFTLPLIATSLFTKQWYCFPALLVLLTLVPFQTLTVSRKTYFDTIGKVFSAKNFEWLSGFRKSFVLLLPMYVLALVFSWLKFFPLFILWIMTVVIMGYYNEFEPLHILRAQAESSTLLLKQKISRHLMLLCALYGPVLFLNSCFQPDYWVVNLIFGIVQCSLLAFSICYKYYMYQPNQKLLAAGMLPMLLALGSLVPFITPVPFVLTFAYYGKARQNLNTYLGD